MSQKKSKGWPEIGVITKNAVRKKDENGKFIKADDGNFVNVTDHNGKTVFKLGFKIADNVTVLVEGEPVALNKSRTGTLTSPVREVENLYKAGQIDDDVIESRREKAKEIHNWLRYKVQLPPPRD
jgi:hypothetical protein